TPARVEAVRHDYGLDRPIAVQYLSYMNKVVHFDFGQSITSQRSVTSEIRRRFPATIELTLAAMLFAIGVGIPLGFWSARRYLSWIDNTSMAGSLLGISIPVFFLAFILKYVFAVKLGWLPSVGRIDVTRDVRHPTGFDVLDVENEDYVRTAEAKGLTAPVVNRRHILKNAMLPVATVIGLQTGLLLSGAVL